MPDVSPRPGEPAPHADPPPDGRRSRTRAALVDAAWVLIQREPLTPLTAEEVAREAGVSRRTLFNHFATLEAVLAAVVDGFFAEISERVEHTDPLDSPGAALACIAESPSDPELVRRLVVLAAVGEHNLQARHVIVDRLHEWVEWLEALLRTRLGPDLDDLHVMGLATGIAAAAESATRVWVRRTGGVITEASIALHQELLASALTYLATGFGRPTGAAAPGPDPAPAPDPASAVAPSTSAIPAPHATPAPRATPATPACAPPRA